MYLFNYRRNLLLFPPTNRPVLIEVSSTEYCVLSIAFVLTVFVLPFADF